MTRVVASITVALLLLASCAGDHRAAVPARQVGPPPATVFVAGDGVTAGDALDDALHNAWPRLVFREAFPLGSILVNGASRDATVDNAIASQLPIAADVHPDAALVWLGTREAAAGGSPDSVEQSLRTLFTQLRTDGAKRIVAAGLPSGIANQSAPAFDAAIERAATAANAQFVDLSTVHLSADRSGTITATPAEHREIADAFVHALSRP
jgi:lysophospholipase L1-like esterase